MTKRYCKLLLLLCCLALLAGCGSSRYTSSLKPSGNAALTLGDARFHLADIELKEVGDKKALQGWLDHIRQPLPKRALELYPQVFSTDWTAVPLTVQATVASEENMIGAMLTGFTGGIIPFPSSMTRSFIVNTAVVDARGDKMPVSQVSFQRKDVLWVSVLGPLGCLPVFGTSDIPRSTMFLLLNAEEQGKRSLEFTHDSLVEAVVSGLRQLEPSRLADIVRARQARLRQVSVEGTPYWSFLAPSFSKGIAAQERADRFVALLYHEVPQRGTQPVETVTVARRGADGRWQPVPAYLRRAAKGLVSVTALLENGAPGRLVVTEVDEPPLEDFIPLPAETAGDQETAQQMAWSNRVLLQAKNRILPGLLKAKPTGELLDLITQVENAFLDLNRMAELAKDRAQKGVADGGDGGAARELSLICRERVDILKPILVAMKQEVAARGGR
jgi:hypothetical protein